MPNQYTVTQTAKILDTSTATVRRLADDFAEHLPDYRPAQGQARKFSEGDVLTLHAISTRLQANPGQTRNDLLRELSEPGSEPLVIPATLPTAKPANPPESPESPKADRAIQTDIDAPQNALAPFLQAHADTQRQIEKLSAQIAEIQSRPAPESRQEWRFPIATVATFGLLLAGVTVSAVRADSQAALWTSALALIVLAIALIWPSMRR